MASYDLTWKMAPFFDRHLVFPLLEFLSDREIYDEQNMLAAKLELLKNTNMVDFAMEIQQSMEKAPVGADLEALKAKRNSVVNELKQKQAQTEPIVKILEDDQVAQQIQQAHDREGKKLLAFLIENFDFHEDMLDMLYNYAKFQYECGNYSGSAEYLYFYRLLVAQHHGNYLNALWGKLASEILIQNWETAKDDLLKLKAYIDNNPFEEDLEALQQRAWLIHWSLFVYFNHQKGRDDLIEMILNSNNNNYLNTILILCPHILRYLAVAVVTNKKRKQSLKEVVRIIELERDNYRDPVTEFLECLYINFDFDSAQQKLRECEEVLSNDFFLIACKEEFIEAARLLIFEMFCRIHQCISIDMLAEKLNMDREEAERWIVNLIRNAQLDAKIDSQLGHVIMGTKATSIHEQVMENTKRLSFRAQSMAFQLEKLEAEKLTPWAAKGSSHPSHH